MAWTAKVSKKRSRLVNDMYPRCSECIKILHKMLLIFFLNISLIVGEMVLPLIPLQHKLKSSNHSGLSVHLYARKEKEGGEAFFII